MSNNVATIYGEPLSGAPVDIRRSLCRPLIICRLFDMLLAIVVFSTILSGGWYKSICILNLQASNCNYATFVGITSLLMASAFVILDCLLSQVYSAAHRKIAVLADLCIACVYTILWLIAAIVIISQWWETPVQGDNVLIIPKRNATCIQTAVAFSIFCIGSWGLTTFFATRRFYYGSKEQEEFASSVNRAVVNNRGFDNVTTVSVPHARPTATGKDSNVNADEVYDEGSARTGALY